MQAFFESTTGKIAVIVVIMILLLLIAMGGRERRLMSAHLPSPHS
jgi:hypothetical protein